VLDFIRRVQTPHYEEARAALIEEIAEQGRDPDDERLYYQDELQRLAR